ncbi:hypothetical protein FH972_023673 [Carpinus fangiana]|uniref:Mitochondrial thiamine pyrophosphate carrier 1 n=1 Tax=Carpinus fangiana TaxID=176857 RepID=A0A5N6KVV4_9ROSI|nr:hypothetical protein FH972_023673 [Carpinus fangiana]
MSPSPCCCPAHRKPLTKSISSSGASPPAYCPIRLFRRHTLRSPERRRDCCAPVSSSSPPSDCPMELTSGHLTPTPGRAFDANDTLVMPRVYPPLEGNRHPTSALPPSMVEVVAGFSAGIVSTLAVHPFDVVKTRLQVDQASNIQVGGSIKIARDLIRREGFFNGYYRGLTPNIIGNSVSWALYFMWYGNIKDLIQAYRGPSSKLHSIDYFTASGASGILTAVFTNPIWVIKTRMLSTAKNAPGAYNNVWDGAKHIWATEGIPGFYRGLVPSLFGVSHGAIQFMAYEQLKIWRSRKIGDSVDVESVSTKNTTGSIGSAIGGALSRTSTTTAEPVGKKAVQQVELSNWDFLTLSAVSKIFAGSITYPYQVVRARLQTYDAKLKYRGAADVVRQVFQKEGIAGFYKGLVKSLSMLVGSSRFYPKDIEEEQQAAS